MTDHLERLVAEIDPELKTLVDKDTRTNRQVVEAALWSEFGGRKKSALEAKRDHKLEQAKAIEASIESEKDDYNRVMSEVDALDAQIEKMEQEGPVYEEDIEAFLDNFAGSRAVFPRFKSEVEDIGTEHNKSLKQVISDIKDYAEEHEYDIEADRWTDAYGDGIL